MECWAGLGTTSVSKTKRLDERQKHLPVLLTALNDHEVNVQNNIFRDAWNYSYARGENKWTD